MNLDHLRPRVDAAVRFARQYPAALRPAIVTYVLGSDGSSTASHEIAKPREVPPTDTTRQVPRDSYDQAGVVQHVDVGVDEIIKSIAADTGVDPSYVNQIFRFAPNGTPTIRKIFDESTIAKRQMSYTVLYLFALEKVERESATSDELRDMLRAKKSYDGPNFTRNYKTSSLVSRHGTPGTRAQEWALSPAGRAEARRLISLGAVPTASAGNRVPITSVELDA
jgi:hypothetical protein